MLAWETVSLMRGELYSEVPVVFENVRFNRATNIPKEGMNEAYQYYRGTDAKHTLILF